MSDKDVFSMSEAEVEAFLARKGVDFDLSILSLDEKHAMAFSVVESALENAAVAATGDSETPGKAYGEGEGVEGATGAADAVEVASSVQSTPPSRVSTMPPGAAEVAAAAASTAGSGDETGTSGLEAWQSELVDEFAEVCGADKGMAMRMLEAFGYDMDSAMVMYMEQQSEKLSGTGGGGGGILPVPPSGAGDGFARMPPIPGGDLHDMVGGMMDRDEDERDSTGPPELDEFGMRRPDEIRRNQRLVDRGMDSGSSYDDVMGRAEDEGVDWMFPPPAHLSFVGNFDMAVDMSNSDKKWLLVNIQYHEEFSSHMLNRDTWSDDTVEQIVRSSFIFWQRGSTSKEAMRYISVYKLEPADMPHISIIDPRTKAKVCSMKGYASPQELIAFLMRFLEDNDITTNKAPKSKVIHNNIDLQQRALDRSALMKDGGSSVEETPPKAGGGDESDSASKVDSLDLSSVARTLDDLASDSAGGQESGSSGDSYGVAPGEPADGAPGSITVRLKLPNGKAIKRRFLPTNTIKELHAVAQEALEKEGINDGPFQLATSFPVKSLSEAKSFHLLLGESDVSGAQILVRNL